MIFAVVHQPVGFARRSGLLPLVEAVGATPVCHGVPWEDLQRRSWRAAQWLRNWGIRHYGSTWNALVPYAHEWLLARRVPAGRGDVVHFLWGEFAAPRHPRWFRKDGAKLVATFHCSQRRLPQVLGRYRCLDAFDRISVMSRSQIPFFRDRGFPADRIDVTLHGVDTDHFRPPAAPRATGGPLRLLIVGFTERDHAFAAQVMRSLRDEPVHLDVLTDAEGGAHYEGVARTTLHPRLGDDALLAAYRAADLLFMPLLDCTANNAVLEAMACGTPVMANDVGGIREYADNGTNLVMPGKDVDAWRAALLPFVRDPGLLAARREATRAWAGRFAWPAVAAQFHAFYQRALAA